MKFPDVTCHAVFIVHRISSKYFTNGFTKNPSYKNLIFITIDFIKELLCSLCFTDVQFLIISSNDAIFHMWNLMANHLRLDIPVFAKNVVEFEVSLVLFNSILFFFSIICMAGIYVIFNICYINIAQYI